MADEAAFILLVEDDPDISAIAVMALRLDPTLTVIPLRTGFGALEHLENSRTPDLILTDTNLPDMDGVALVDAVRTLIGDASPIAFLTAAVRPSELASHAAAGVVGTIAKPFDPIGLAAQVRALLPSTFS